MHKERSPYEPYLDEVKKSLSVGTGVSYVFFKEATKPLVKIVEQRYPILRLVFSTFSDENAERKSTI